MRIFSKIRNSPDSRTHPRSKIRSQKGKQRNHSNFGIKIILVIPAFKFTWFPILPDNPKRLAPLEILRNFRRQISHQSPVNLRTDGKKLGHFELAILHTFLPSVFLKRRVKSFYHQKVVQKLLIINKKIQLNLYCTYFALQILN